MVLTKKSHICEKGMPRVRRKSSQKGYRKQFRSRDEMLAHISELYYQNGLNQSDIAKLLGLSRSMISRLLIEARERGIVEFRIHRPIFTNPDLERELVVRFGLQTARVLDVEHLPYPELLRQLGKLAASELVMHLQDRMTVATAWGMTIWELVQALPYQAYPNLRVVQCVGALGNQQSCDTPLVVQRMAQALGAQYFLLHAPLIVESEAVCAQLLQQRMIWETLEMARHADLLVVGIGSVEPEVSSLKRAGYLSEAELVKLARDGAVGDICGRYLDLAGQPIPTPFDGCLVGITLEDIRRIPCVFAVAGGAAKGKAILAALRSGLLHILVTDKGAALEVLRHSNQLSGGKLYGFTTTAPQMGATAVGSASRSGAPHTGTAGP